MQYEYTGEAVNKRLEKMATIYKRINEYEQALNALSQLEVIYDDGADLNGLASVMFAKAEIKFLMRDYGLSEDYYFRADELYRSTGNLTLLAKVHENLGDVRVITQDYEKATEFHQFALELYQNLGDLNSVATTYYKLANDNYMLKKFDMALELLHQSDRLAEIRNLESLIADINLKYSEIYEALGNTEKKQSHYNMYLNSRNLLFNRQKLQELAEQRVKYETEKMEQEILLLQKDSQLKAMQVKQRSFLLYFSSAIVLLILFLLVILYRKNRFKQKTNLLLTRQTEKLESQYRDLQARNEQISVQKMEIEERVKEKEIMLRELHHRVKNNLQVVYSMLNIQSRRLNDPQAVAALKSSIHRIWAMALIHHKLYLDENLTRIRMQEYINDLISNILETFTDSANAIKIKQNIEDINLEADLAIPLGLIINELVINSIKHAFNGSENPELNIRLQKQINNGLALSVRDNGAGYPDNFGDPKNGHFGMELVKLLAKQLHARAEFANKNGAYFSLIIDENKSNNHG